MQALALALLAALATAVVPPLPAHRVEDHAGFLTPATRDALDAKLESYERATGHQIVVWIGQTLENATLEEWAVRTFEAWKIGRTGLDDGIAIFVLAGDRTIDIEVGYGLEEKVPDAVASRIIRDVMAPRLRAGEHDAAITAGVDAVLQAIEGRPWSAASSTPKPHGPSPLEWLGYALLAVVALVLMVRYPRAAMWIFFSLLRGGGTGNGSGGFRGGGGRSGGGGARGSW